MASQWAGRLLQGLVAVHLLSSSCFAERRPNVIVFLTDDESWIERSAYGQSTLPTPHFDWAAQNGVLFTHAYSSAPSCAPARAALLTGRNFWELEQGAYIQAWLPKKFPVLPQLLKASGYQIARNGKGWGPGIFNDESHARDFLGQPFQGRRVKDVQKDINPVDYIAGFENFLTGRDESQPYFFWMGITEPHAPWAADNHQKLITKYGVRPEDLLVPEPLPDTPRVRQSRADYAYEICYADEQLGRLIRLLESRDELENTLLIISADNGTSLFRAKASPYDLGVHVPMAIVWKGTIPAGRVIEDFVNFRDIAPSVLEAAQTSVPSEMTGRSLLTTLKSTKQGRVEPDRDFMVTGLEWHGELSPVNFASRSIRDRRFAYIRNYGNVPGRTLSADKKQDLAAFDAMAPRLGLTELAARFPHHEKVRTYHRLLTEDRPAEEFYDLESDPGQVRNVITDPRFQDELQRLKTRLNAYQVQTQDPRVTGRMNLFDETRKFVEERKRRNYQD